VADKRPLVIDTASGRPQEIATGDAVPLANGGTGATTQAAARTALGLGTLATQNGAFSGTSSGTNTGDETATSIGAVINGASNKATLADGDLFGVADSAASFLLKDHTWANLKTNIKAWYDAVASTFTNKTFDTAGAGNVLQVNSVTVSVNTGTGNTMVRSVRPTITEGVLGYARAYPLMAGGGKNFNGTTTYMDTNALTGVVDSQVGSIFLKVRFANAATGTERFWHSSGDAFQFSRNAAGAIQVVGENAAGAAVLNISSANGACSAAGTYVIMISFNLATASTGRIWINEVSSYVETTYTTPTGTIDYTVAENAIGGSVTGTTLFAGDLYALWFSFTEYLDWSTESVRRRFTDPEGTLLYLGFNGSYPTGTAPGVYHALDDSDLWHVNRGSLQATTWTNNGAIADPAALNAQKCQWAPLQEFGRTLTVTADHSVGRTTKHLIVNKGSSCNITLPSAAASMGRELLMQVITAHTVVSVASNVMPETSATPGTAILPATDGTSRWLRATGANWQASLS
jgi:hypothetical protein